MLFIIWGTSASSGALTTENISYAKNYLILLVHGIGDDHACLNNVKNYLEAIDINGDSKGDLNGYVYAYEFSDPFLNIAKEGWEFGSRTYDNPEAVRKKSDVIGDNSSDQTKRKSWEITKRLDNGQAGTGKSWLEQAKEDFKIWFKKDGPGKAEDREPLVSEIPSKYIVIAHSMGG
ncbi:MAG: hypothetical protein KKC80_03435, partial [Candidatus Margulisbacteria bacterium]|nr:hypothetical protein [Candidatus Margulisiibacteriota bacterium]MBU1616870.1 hypothetical protein [Candidatus Margulisiibacteriota bacterium]